ncbi:MAG: (2Fe-2S)-binding protein [Acidobacteria bacterium]|nr:(2Fe-2S)-binding protein [Acidobacteriota bacterium]
MSTVNLKVNGRSVTVDVDPTTPLLYILRNDLDLNGPRFGCGLGQCGACTVIVEGEAIRSCITPVETVQGFEITTLEGLEKDGKLDPVQQAWIDAAAMQCGTCQNGQIMNAKALLDINPHPTDQEIRLAMQGILCRCATYVRIQDAIRRAIPLVAAAKAAARMEVVA